MNTGGVAAFGGPSFRYWSKNGFSTSRRNSSAVSPCRASGPSVDPL
jgi:hypothetical protein